MAGVIPGHLFWQKGAMEHPILMTIRNQGFMPLGWFAPTPADDVPDIKPGEPAKFVMLLGNAGPDMFRRFARERDPDRQSLDDWTRHTLEPVAENLGARALFPFGGPPWLPILSWARRGGAGHVSPLGLNIHPSFGLWHAYRAAFLFPVAFDLPPPKSISPCDTCQTKPCLTACPVGAFSGEAYDRHACASHLRAAEGAPCYTGGCLARHACPVGQGFAYAPAQAHFHMRAFRTARDQEN
jgi:hypothetical protein